MRLQQFRKDKKYIYMNKKIINTTNKEYDTHLCQTCKYRTKIHTWDDWACGYCLQTGMLRHSDPSNCNQYEQIKEGEKRKKYRRKGKTFIPF